MMVREVAKTHRPCDGAVSPFPGLRRQSVDAPAS